MENFDFEKKKIIKGNKTSQRYFNGQRQIWFILIISIGFLIVLPFKVKAASLYFSPSSGSYNIGQSFSVAVYVSTSNQVMNAASGVVSFPPDKLEVVSLSKNESIFNIWIQEPSFSNTNGTINFEGIVLNPGFASTGKIITINFKVKGKGTALLTFSSGAVLANDGQGTNILEKLGNASFFLGETSFVPESTTSSEIQETPLAPQVFSPTHSDPLKWYNNPNPKFQWLIPEDVIAVRVSYNQLPKFEPSNVYSPPISEKQLENVRDGIWYFHVQFKNKKGWGGISHFRFQIDTEKPIKFDIREIEREDHTNPKVKFIFDSYDKLSGIDYYEVQIDNGNSQVWRDDGNGIFETPTLGPGKHMLLAKVFDKAGNFLANSSEFTIEPLESPKIIHYPQKLNPGEFLVVKGSTYPNVHVMIWLQREKDEPHNYSVNSDNSGSFTFVAEEKLKEGIYKLWAEVIDERGARSLPTEKMTIIVEQPSILKIGAQVITILAIIVPLVALIIFLLILIFYGWQKLSSLRKRIRKESKEAKQALSQAFNALKLEIEKQIAELDGKPGLRGKEKKICNNLKRALDVSEKFIGKEVEDIEKELN